MDFNGIAVGAIVSQKLDINEDVIRHIVLNNLRSYNKKFRDKYGQMVIAMESGSWRRGYFPNYKYKRRAGRKESDTDWESVYEILNKIRDEIADNLPYKVIKVDGAEADDIIGVLAQNTQEFGQHEDVMIVSGDKDFVQLQKYNNIKQYSPITKKFLSDPNPDDFLIDHIFKGDSSDGVPNMLSGDDVFVTGERQTPMTQKKMSALYETLSDPENMMDNETYRNYIRNKKLIDLSETPEDIWEEIIYKYNNTKVPHKSKVLNYLIKNKCRNLIECVADFY